MNTGPAIDPSLPLDELEDLAKTAFFWGMHPAGAYEMRYAYTQLESAPAYVGKSRMSWRRSRTRASEHEITTPNFSTLYGFGFFDLREGPMVVQTPRVEGRYWSWQAVDQYARWYAPLGTPFTGSSPQRRLIVGPNEKGPLPAGFKGVEIIRAPSDYACVAVRLALQDDTEAELAAVHAIMDGLTTVPLREWEAHGRKPLPAKDQRAVRADHATFPRMSKLVDIATEMTGVDLLKLVSLVLNDPSMTKRTDSLKEVETLRRLARIGLAEGSSFDPAALSGVQKEAVERGVAEGKRESLAVFERLLIDMNGWKLASDWNADRNDYEVAAYFGLTALFGPVPFYSHSGALLMADSEGRPLHGGHRYTLTFDVENLPPVTEFWELPVYDLNGYFVENELHRYAVNSYMFHNGDFTTKGGKLTFYIQKSRPTDPEQARNWLPVPADRFRFAARFYGPTAPLIDGTYPMPGVVRVG